MKTAKETPMKAAKKPNIECLLTEQEFFELLDFISAKYIQQDKLCGLMDELSEVEGCGYCSNFIYDSYMDKTLALLAKVMDDKDDKIGIFLFDNENIYLHNKPNREELCRRLYDELIQDMEETE